MFKKYFLSFGMQIWKQLKNTLTNKGSLTSPTLKDRGFSAISYKERAEEILREGSIGLLKHGIIWDKVIDCMLEFHNERLREDLYQYEMFNFDNPTAEIIIKEINENISEYLKSKE